MADTSTVTGVTTVTKKRGIPPLGFTTTTRSTQAFYRATRPGGMDPKVVTAVTAVTDISERSGMSTPFHLSTISPTSTQTNVSDMPSSAGEEQPATVLISEATQKGGGNSYVGM